jgi:hypothetical protein
MFTRRRNEAVHHQVHLRPRRGCAADWHRHIAEFIAALDADPELRGKIRYRVTKSRESDDYFHAVEAADDAVVKALGTRDFFKRYTEETRRVAAGTLSVQGVDTIAETSG